MNAPSTHFSEVQPSSYRWSTVRFRRAKTSKAWTLLGIPANAYPMVAYRLFELKAKLLEKYEKGSFVSVLFEAPPDLAAKLALAFPAPPGCNALRIAQSGDRILAGKAARSAGAIHQATDPSDDVPEFRAGT